MKHMLMVAFGQENIVAVAILPTKKPDSLFKRVSGPFSGAMKSFVVKKRLFYISREFPTGMGTILAKVLGANMRTD